MTYNRDGRSGRFGALLSLSEMAAYLGVHKTTAWRWHKAGKLTKPIDMGGRSYWVKSVLQDHLEQMSTNATDAEGEEAA